MTLVTDEKIELLPCPFCGSAAELVVQFIDIIRITCSDWKSCGMFPQIKTTEAAAIAAWNRRPLTTELQSLRAGAVRVKELEWGPYRNGDADAVTSYGIVYSAYSSGHWRTDKNPKFRQGGTNLADAKAAAQADFSRHVLSAIEPVAVEPAAWQWRYVGEDQWKTQSGGERIDKKALAREQREIEQRPLYPHPSPEVTITDEMVERAARSLCVSLPISMGDDPPDPDEMAFEGEREVGPIWACYSNNARAALTAALTKEGGNG